VPETFIYPLAFAVTFAKLRYLTPNNGDINGSVATERQEHAHRKVMVGKLGTTFVLKELAIVQ
jgi:hypothetical protein